MTIKIINFAMMEPMKQRLSSGQSAQQPGPQAGQKPPQGGKQAQQSQAEQLKTSLDGIRLSAVYLTKSKFVK